MKILKYRVPVFAMSANRSYVEQKMRTMSEMLLYHIVKVGLYGNSTRDLHHWLSEIAACLSLCNSYTIKPKGKKLKADRYKEFLFEGWGEESLQDVKSAVLDFFFNNRGKYPEIELDNKILYQVSEIYLKIRDYALDLLPTKNNKSTSEILKDLEALLE